MLYQHAAAMSASTPRGPRGGSAFEVREVRHLQCRRLAVVLEGCRRVQHEEEAEEEAVQPRLVQPQAERGCFKSYAPEQSTVDSDQGPNANGRGQWHSAGQKIQARYMRQPCRSCSDHILYNSRPRSPHQSLHTPSTIASAPGSRSSSLRRLPPSEISWDKTTSRFQSVSQTPPLPADCDWPWRVS